MKILYIGPYRDNSPHGFASLNIIDSLKSKCSLNIKPIIISNNIIENLDQELLYLENQPLTKLKYDIVIQHAPIDYLIPFNIYGIKNYGIPIIPFVYNETLKNKYNRIFKYFNEIFIDSSEDAAWLKNFYAKNKKLKIFRYAHKNNIKISEMSFHSKDAYKFYTFVDQNNISNILSIISAFILLQKKINECILIIGVNKQEAKNISDQIDFLIKKTGIKYLKNYIVILETSSIENILSIHNSADCCIDIKLEINRGFNTNIAKLYSNTTISNENLDMSLDMELSRKNFALDNLYPTVNIHNLSNKMLNAINITQSNNIDIIPTIDSIICK